MRESINSLSYSSKVAQLAFYEEIRHYEKLETDEERKAAAREIYDNYIMRELLSHTHVSIAVFSQPLPLFFCFLLWQNILRVLMSSSFLFGF